MSASEPLFGETLEAWLDRLASEGFRVGVRERLRVHRLLESLTPSDADGAAPPASEGVRLEWLAPILCASALQQRRYGELLRDFLAVEPARRIAQAPRTGERAEERGWRRYRAEFGLPALVVVLALGLVAAGIWGFRDRTPAGAGMKTQVVATGLASTGLVANPTPAGATNPVIPLVLVGNAAHVEFARGARGDAEVRRVAWTLAALGGLFLACVFFGYGRRQLYLRGTRTDREVEEKVLRDPTFEPLNLVTARLRAAVRGLRQRVTGSREILDAPRTIASTLRAGGAFQPRYRHLRSTPEFLVLIDRRHPFDHFSEYGTRLVRSLSDLGLVVQVRYFEGSPEHGCWEERPTGGAGERTPRDRRSWSEMCPRHEGQRLLVFSEPAPLLDPVKGGLRSWAKSFDAFPDRAWFTPLPIPAWDAGEGAADTAGFLVLPAQPESMNALAGWLASENPALDVEPDWPASYPARLRDEGLAWVVRGTPPPPGEVEDLLFQLRSYLGASGFQWLCACAIFPAVSPPLTLALGRELAGTPRELALGMAAMGGLPWFRHGHLPEWLRQRLVDRLSPENEARYRRVIERLLGDAVLGPKGVELARVAARRRVWAWLKRARRPVRDVVLVAFLRKDAATRLAQRLPEGLRKRLFKDGLPAYGLKAAWVTAMVGLTVLLAVLPWAWSAWGAPESAPAINSLGMRFVPVPGTDVLFSVWETRVQDYAAFAATVTNLDGSWRDPVFENVPITPGPTHPVVNVSWTEANRFCEWLTAKERSEGRISAGQRYRLPTDREWSAAVGLPIEPGRTPGERDRKIPDVYPWGTDWPPSTGAGNFPDESFKTGFPNLNAPAYPVIDGYSDGYAATSPVGSFATSRVGLFDLAGNAWEWCEDRYESGSDNRVLRGGSWFIAHPSFLLSSCRVRVGPGLRSGGIGFRVVLVRAGAVR